MTIHRDGFPKHRTLYDAINVINGPNLIRDGAQVHIVNGHHRYAVFEELRKDLALRFHPTGVTFRRSFRCDQMLQPFRMCK